MAALSADLSTLKKRNRTQTTGYVVKDAQAMYFDSLCGLDANGVLIPWTDAAAAQRFLGLFQGFNPALTSGAPTTVGETDTPVRGIVREDGAVLFKVDVAGVSTRASIGEPVYCATDNIADLTLTPTAFVKPVGVLSDFRSTSDMDVRLFTPAEYAGYGSIGTWSIPVALAQITGAGDVLTTWTPGFRGRILRWAAHVKVVVTTASKAATLNLEVNTTNLTGGTIALTSANCTPLGALIDQGSAFTAGMAFDADDTLSVEAASVTAFAEGEVILTITYQADE